MQTESHRKGAVFMKRKIKQELPCVHYECLRKAIHIIVVVIFQYEECHCHPPCRSILLVCLENQTLMLTEIYYCGSEPIERFVEEHMEAQERVLTDGMFTTKVCITWLDFTVLHTLCVVVSAARISETQTTMHPGGIVCVCAVTSYPGMHNQTQISGDTEPRR